MAPDGSSFLCFTLSFLLGLQPSSVWHISSPQTSPPPTLQSCGHFCLLTASATSISSHHLRRTQRASTLHPPHLLTSAQENSESFHLPPPAPLPSVWIVMQCRSVWLTILSPASFKVQCSALNTHTLCRFLPLTWRGGGAQRSCFLLFDQK